MSNSILSRSIKTDFKGIYKKETKKGFAFIARYTLNKKTKTHIVGYEEDGITEYDAFKIRLDLISSHELTSAIEKTSNERFLFHIHFKNFIDYRESFFSKNTNQNYKSIYNQYILKDFFNKDIRNIKSDELQKYINCLLMKRRPSTVEKIVSAFKKFYIYLQSNDIYRYNAAINLKIPKYDNKKYFSITKKDLNKLIFYIKSMDSDFYRTLFKMLLHGRRVNEIRTLKWADIDFNNKIYHLNYKNTKTKKNQYYFLEEFQLEELINLRKQNLEKIYVFENPNTKKPITYTSIFRVHDKMRKQLNIDYFTIHSFRHLVGYLIVNKGYPLEIVSKLLGHSDIKSSSRYAVLEMSKAKKAYKQTISKILEE